MRSTFIRGLSRAAWVAGACGCMHAQPLPPPSIWPTVIASVEMPKPERKGEGIRLGSIAVSDEIARLCTIRTPSGSAPRFPFDSDDIGDDEQRILGIVARCFIAGPLRGRAMKLTGHADPRGEEEYDMTLGALRAMNVKGYLGQHGVDMRTIEGTSRGELDATGDEEGGWARDWRVDIDLVR